MVDDEREPFKAEFHVWEDRGLGVYEFVDRYGKTCTLQDSSLATEPAVWLGVDEGDSPRMHLTVEMARWLAKRLVDFADRERVVRDEDCLICYERHGAEPCPRLAMELGIMGLNPGFRPGAWIELRMKGVRPEQISVGEVFSLDG